MVLVANFMDLVGLLFSKKVHQTLETYNLAINFGDKFMNYFHVENLMAQVIMIIQNDQTKKFEVQFIGLNDFNQINYFKEKVNGFIHFDLIKNLNY